jgi:hypothetical protein
MKLVLPIIANMTKSLKATQINHAAVAFAAVPEFKKLHARAKRVVKARKKLIASITDPSLRASVS